MEMRNKLTSTEGYTYDDLVECAELFIRMTGINRDASIKTFSGRKFYLFRCTPDDIYIEDICHSLPLLCRYTGHVKRLLSVGQHTLEGLRIDIGATQELLQHWYFHDAEEAYIGDMSGPLKRAGCNFAYSVAGSHISRQIAIRNGLEYGFLKNAVKTIDNIVYDMEERWRNGDDSELTIMLDPDEVEKALLNNYRDLFGR